ncbi:MAG: hypothetical protein KF773_02540 [Deltaproteobacteria bacterium]|nr:hypothetical protein [Deltaproteobacteria bacterium]MCW5801146.1 hypothetical protein [Deltaproteobacteria bacterium]
MSTAEKENLERFVRELPAELEALEYDVRAQGATELLPLDRSYDSLDRLEDFYTMVLDGRGRVGSEQVEPRLGRYVGATLIERTGGKWDYARTKEHFGKPCVTNLPDLKKHRFFPLGPILGFKRTRIPGDLRNAVEVYDVPYRRAQVADILASLDTRIAALSDDIRDLTGEKPVLDYSVASSAFLEAALLASLSRELSRERWRKLELGSILYLGTIVQHALGGGAWTLCEAPNEFDFGQLHMHGWAPRDVVRRMGPETQGIIKRTLDVVISSRRKA